MANIAAAHASGIVGWPPSLVAVEVLGAFAAVAAAVDAYLAACLFAFQRPNPLGIALAAALAAGPVIVSAAKFAFLRAPARSGDALLLGDLARATDASSLAVAAGLAAAVALAFALNAKRVRPRLVFRGLSPLVAACALLVTAHQSPTVSAWLIRPISPRIYDLPYNGHILNAFAEHVIGVDRRHAIQRTLASGQATPPSALANILVPPLDRRNVHMVVVESLMDPLWLGGFAFSPAEPRSPLFARWRAEGGGSTALVPIFGGRSANTEYEVLCGLPAAVGPAEIAYRLLPRGKEPPCLPRILASHGYRTVATAVTGPGFFNVGPALAAAGFEARVFAADLDMSDRDGIWLSAESTLRQTADRAASLGTGGAPVLSHVFVASGHYPYERDKARRPDRVSVAPYDPTVRDWANGAHYNAAAIEGFVERIRAADPRALIFVLGDQQPSLQAKASHRADGRPDAADGTAPFQATAMFETPLLVLDAGEVVPVGRLPAYLLPEFILDRLSGGGHCRRNACAHREPWRLRPFREHAFEVEAHGPGERLCGTVARDPGGTGPACVAAVARSHAWLAALWQAFTPAAARTGSGG